MRFVQHIVKEKSLFLSLMLELASNLNLFRLSIIRGCMTSGEEWSFFVYKSPTASESKALFLFSKAFGLGSKLERLPLILGLLKNMVCANWLLHFQMIHTLHRLQILSILNKSTSNSTTCDLFIHLAHQDQL